MHMHKRPSKSKSCLKRSNPVRIGTEDLLIAAAAAASDDDSFHQNIKPKLRALQNSSPPQDLNRNQQLKTPLPVSRIAAPRAQNYATRPVSAFVRKLQRLQMTIFSGPLLVGSSMESLDRSYPASTSVTVPGQYAPRASRQEGSMDNQRLHTTIKKLTDDGNYTNTFQAALKEPLLKSSKDSLSVPDMQQGMKDNGKRPASESFEDCNTRNKRSKHQETLVDNEYNKSSDITSPSNNLKRRTSYSDLNNQKRPKISHPVDLTGNTPIGNSDPKSTAKPSTQVEASPVLKISRDTATARTTLFADANNGNARKLIARLRASKFHSIGAATAPSTTTHIATATTTPTIPITAAKDSVPAPQETNLSVPAHEQQQPAEETTSLGKRKRATETSSSKRLKRPPPECARKYYSSSLKSQLDKETHLANPTPTKTNPTINSSSPLKLSFLDLPAEIRNQIYTLILRQSSTIIPQYICEVIYHPTPHGRILAQEVISKRDPPPFSRPLTIFQANKQIRNETLAIFFARKQIILGGIHHVGSFLEQIGRDARGLITELSFKFNKSKGAKKAVEMLAQCTRLEKVSISVDETKLLGNDKSWETPTRKFGDKVNPLKLKDKISLLRNVQGMRELYSIKGLDVVDIRVDRPFRRLSDESRGRFVNWLREGMTRPR
ncbi:MAG: hypothetical protein M1812_006151 [Candelaria pacifica]|nr:MAG: hypothetical protein M1812_006151 [Candelaria pacifica]